MSDSLESNVEMSRRCIREDTGAQWEADKAGILLTINQLWYEVERLRRNIAELLEEHRRHEDAYWDLDVDWRDSQ